MIGSRLRFVLPILISAEILTALTTECPGEDLIKPCQISVSFNECHVVCSKLENATLLQKINKHFKHPYILKLVEPNFTSVPDHFFKDLNLLEIHFLNTSISHIGNKAFVSLENTLRKVVFTKSKLSAVPSSSVRMLDKLQTFEVSESKELKEISASQLSSLPKNLSQIILDKNDIRTLPAGCFAKHQKLTSISVSGNKLDSLPASKYPSSLESINLWGNNFKELPVEALNTFPNGVGFEFGNNHITDIPYSILSNLNVRHQRFYVKGNPIQCDCDMKWVAREVGEEPRYIVGRCRGNNTRNHVSIFLLTPYDFRECPTGLYYTV